MFSIFHTLTVNMISLLFGVTGLLQFMCKINHQQINICEVFICKNARLCSLFAQLNFSTPPLPFIWPSLAVTGISKLLFFILPVFFTQF